MTRDWMLTVLAIAAPYLIPATAVAALAALRRSPRNGRGRRIAASHPGE